MALVLLACYHNSLRVHTYLLRAALVPPSHSPWCKLCDKGDLSLFLHVTGLMREAFNHLLNIVIPPGHSMQQQRRGRPWLLPPDGMLGLLLCYLGSQMKIKWLCLIFRITPLLCSRILKKSLYESEAVAISSAREYKVPKQAEYAEICGDKKSPRTNNIKCHHIRIGIGDGKMRITAATTVIHW